MPRIDNWSTTCNFDPYTAPECQAVLLQGNITGHPRFADGEHITTSAIVGIEKREILTRSGTIYKLGRIDRRFRNWLRKNRPLWNWREPIIFLNEKGKQVQNDQNSIIKNIAINKSN
jgi:hypothetical protein